MKKFHQESCVLTHAEPSHADSDALTRYEKQTLSAFHGSLYDRLIQLRRHPRRSFPQKERLYGEH